MELKRVIIIILRLLLAFVFIFSGFVKAVDPWGTALLLEDYFSAFGMPWLDWSKYAASVLLSGGEMFLGFALLFRLGEKRASLWVMAVMAFFTLLTLVLAILNPVEDCGCFGDAIKLTNWQTFYKNLILLPCAAALWMLLRKTPPSHTVHPMVEGSMVFACALFSAGVGIYALRHLPVIDFLPFKQGVHIPTAMTGTEDQGTGETLLIYRDRTTGKKRTFTLDDTEWYDTVKWEFVDTRITGSGEPEGPAIKDFAIFRNGRDLTYDILHYPLEQIMITLDDPARLKGDCREKLRGLALYGQKNGYPVFCITSAVAEPDIFDISDDVGIPVYNIDGVTLKTMIRAHSGVVILKDGVIIRKWNCRDLPAGLNESANPVLSSFLISGDRVNSEIMTVMVIAGLCALVCVIYFMYRRN